MKPVGTMGSENHLDQPDTRLFEADHQENTMQYSTNWALLVISKIAVITSLLFSANVHAADPVPDEVQAIFANSCLTNCHQGNSPSGGLSLDDAATSGNALVDIVANCSNNGSNLVEPGDPAVSALYIKISSTNPNCGGIMPPGVANRLSDNDINTIFDWIVSIGPAAQFGLISMEDTSVTVQETDADVTLTVNRELGTQGAVTVDFVVSTVGADTAVSPTDYIAQTGTLAFADGETSKTITVTLADDDVFEGTEVFSVTLSNALGGAVLGGATQSKISITDNEFDNQPGTFFFSRVSYSSAEDAGDMEVMVIRSFGAAGQVTVDVNSTDGMALSNSDYQTVNTTLVFEEGIRNLTFNVVIVDDAIEESTESFTLTLSSPGNGAILGAPQSVTVTINDNDAPDNGGGGDNGGGDTSGGDNGGGDTSGGDNGGDDPIPAEEVDFEPAGSLTYLVCLLAIFAIKRRRKQR